MTLNPPNSVDEEENQESGQVFIDTSTQRTSHQLQQNHLSSIKESQDWDSQVQDDPKLDVIVGSISNLQNDVSSSNSYESGQRMNNFPTHSSGCSENAYATATKAKIVEALS